MICEFSNMYVLFYTFLKAKLALNVFQTSELLIFGPHYWSIINFFKKLPKYIFLILIFFFFADPMPGFVWQRYRGHHIIKKKLRKEKMEI
jgi:hypothetical protein